MWMGHVHECMHKRVVHMELEVLLGKNSTPKVLTCGKCVDVDKNGHFTQHRVEGKEMERTWWENGS